MMITKAQLALMLCLLIGAPVSAQTDKDKIEVTVSGTGLDEDKALRQAFRNAIMQVVGTIVDAETVIANDQVIKDQILTASNAIVVGFAPVGKPKVEDGLVTVHIRATVQKKQLEERLVASKVVTNKAVDGLGLFAKLVTEAEQVEDHGKMIFKLFEGFPANVMTAGVVGEPRVVGRVGDDVEVSVVVRFEVDEKKYAQWRRAVEPVFAKLATAKSRGKLPEGDKLRDFRLDYKGPLPARGRNTYYGELYSDVFEFVESIPGKREKTMDPVVMCVGGDGATAIYVFSQQMAPFIRLSALQTPAFVLSAKGKDGVARILVEHPVYFYRDTVGEYMSFTISPLWYTELRGPGEQDYIFDILASHDLIDQVNKFLEQDRLDDDEKLRKGWLKQRILVAGRLLSKSGVNANGMLATGTDRAITFTMSEQELKSLGEIEMELYNHEPYRASTRTTFARKVLKPFPESVAPKSPMRPKQSKDISSDKSDLADDKPSKKEIEAKSQLALAKLYLEAKKTDIAIKQLRQIVVDFAGTTVAADAQKLLDSIDPSSPRSP